MSPVANKSAQEMMCDCVIQVVVNSSFIKGFVKPKEPRTTHGLSSE